MQMARTLNHACHSLINQICLTKRSYCYTSCIHTKLTFMDKQYLDQCCVCFNFKHKQTIIIDHISTWGYCAFTVLPVIRVERIVEMPLRHCGKSPVSTLAAENQQEINGISFSQQCRWHQQSQTWLWSPSRGPQLWRHSPTTGRSLQHWARLDSHTPSQSTCKNRPCGQPSYVITDPATEFTVVKLLFHLNLTVLLEVEARDDRNKAFQGEFVVTKIKCYNILSTQR